MSKIVVLIDASSSVVYGSFYIKGLQERYGNKNVTFTYKPFAKLSSVGRNIRFIVMYENKITKYFIHTTDSFHIDKNNYEWADVYGHVNANFKYYPKKEYPKIVSLVPSFAIRNFNFAQTIYFSIKTFIIAFNAIIKTETYNKSNKTHEINKLNNIKRHFLNYLKNYFRRETLNTYYISEKLEENYVFFLSTLWYNDEYNKNDEGVNKRRLMFIESCKENSYIVFEGGLLADGMEHTLDFSHVVTKQKEKFKTWLNKTKKSVTVFNTPAFWNCHGWKLGEYMALKKAIISTPLYNDLPSPLIHGEHVHFIKENDVNDYYLAIQRIINDVDYRNKLEENINSYWIQFGTPQKSLDLLGLP